MKKLILCSIVACLVGNQVTAQQPGCSIMSITKLHPGHSLTKAGLVHRRTVRQLEVGAEPGDVVFQFPRGRVVHTSHENKHAGYGMFVDGVVPKDVNRLQMHKEFLLAESENKHCGEKK